MKIGHGPSSNRKTSDRKEAQTFGEAKEVVLEGSATSASGIRWCRFSRGFTAPCNNELNNKGNDPPVPEMKDSMDKLTIAAEQNTACLDRGRRTSNEKD